MDRLGVGLWPALAGIVVITLVIDLYSAAPLGARAKAAAAVGMATSIAVDSFSRATTNGWARAEGGGAWQLTAPVSSWRVRGGAGSIVLATPGKEYVASLPTMTRDLDATATVRLNRRAAAGAAVHLVGRRVGSQDYRGRVRVSPDGTVHAAALRHVGGIDHLLGPEVTVAGVRWNAATRLGLRWRVQGAAPSQVKLRVWDRAGAEPSAWNVSASNADPALQRSGAVGVMARAMPSAPRRLRVRVDDVRVITGPPEPRSFGGAAVGTTTYPVPSGARFVATNGSDTNPGTHAAPYRSLGRAVSAAPPGTTIVMRGGIYRESVTWFGKQLTIQPYPNESVWMRGSEITTGWVADGTAWRKDGWNPAYDRTVDHGLVDPGAPLAAAPDQVFVDGARLSQVATRSAVVSGTFFADVPARRLYVGTNPTGRNVEVSTLGRAMYVNHATGSVIRGLGFERYATSTSQLGAVFGEADNLVFENDTFRHNAAAGLSVDGTGIVVGRSRFDSNGQLGLHGNTLQGSVIWGNAFVGNNTERFLVGGASGGLKLTTATNVHVVDNLSERNLTRGLWFDIASSNVTVARNVVRGNGDRGIQHEISAGAVVVGNVVRDNGGAGIAVIEATNVQIYNNTLDRNQRGIDVIDGNRAQTLSGVAIRNNVITGARSATNNLLNVNDVSGRRSAEAMGVSVDYDAYGRTSASSPRHVVAWSSHPAPIRVFTNVTDFRAATGQEVHGSHVDGVPDSWYVDAPGGDLRIAPGSAILGRAVALPGPIAAALGLPAGTMLDPGAP